MSSKKVVIIDYQLGNLFSVKHACDNVGIDSEISTDIAKLASADALILPGVGAFKEAMNNLQSLGLENPIKDAILRGKPFFGVCLGLQMLFTESEEFGNHKGLGLIEGKIRKFPYKTEFSDNIKVPQIGWNQIKGTKDWRNTPLEGLSDMEYMYFVHSYYADASNPSDIITKTTYEGLEYCSAILKDNLFATQFHPEKSAANGLSIYKNWAVQNGLI